MNYKKDLNEEFLRICSLKDDSGKFAKSNSAKEFFMKLDVWLLNYKMIYPIGINEYWNSMSVKANNLELCKEYIKIQDHLFYGSSLNSLITFLEQFFYELLIEKLGKIKVKSKNELTKYLKKEYKRKRIYKKYISFQNLYSVSDHFNLIFNVDLTTCTDFKEMNKYMEKYRHIFTHSFGKNDDNNDEILCINAHVLDMALIYATSLVKEIDLLFQ